MELLERIQLHCLWRKFLELDNGSLEISVNCGGQKGGQGKIRKTLILRHISKAVLLPSIQSIQDGKGICLGSSFSEPQQGFKDMIK